MKLLDVDGSPFARIVRILIGAWQLQVSLQEVDFPLPTDVDALTPMGQVPLLLREGEPPLFPTLNIIEHLARLASEMANFATRTSIEKPLSLPWLRATRWSAARIRPGRGCGLLRPTRWALKLAPEISNASTGGSVG